MTCLTLTYVTVVMIGVNILCTLALGAILMAIGGSRFKKLSHVSNVTGKEVFRLSTIGYAVFFVVQTILFAVTLSMQLGMENFA